MPVDDLLAQRFDALPSPPDDADWLDVRRRAQRDRWLGRRTGIAALAAALVVAIATPAFALHEMVVDWFAAEPAPEKVQLDFNELGVGAPPGMDPQVIPNSARKVTHARIGGSAHTLWVAPTRKGGFCYLWAELSGGCVDPDRLVGRSSHASDLNPGLLGLSWQPDERGVLQQFSGHLHARETERLTVEFADGDSAEIPVVWVSAPIDAGFYVYEVPERHLRVGAHVTAVVATDADGDVLARQVFRLTPPDEVRRPVRLPDGQLADLPAKAIVEQARRVIDFRSASGDRVTLWVVPTRDGGRCYAFNRGSGCTDPRRVHEPPMAPGLLGGGRPVVFVHARDDVAIVELRYEDGAVERLKPVEGFVLHEIDSRHYERGHRLELIVALDARGRELKRHHVRTNAFGVYPCEKPVAIGGGGRACP